MVRRVGCCFFLSDAVTDVIINNFLLRESDFKGACPVLLDFLSTLVCLLPS